MSATLLIAELFDVSAALAPELVFNTLALIPSVVMSIACALTVIVLPSTVLSTVRLPAPDVIKLVLFESDPISLDTELA